MPKMSFHCIKLTFKLISSDYHKMKNYLRKSIKNDTYEEI
jgi:hypothetical protein